MLKGISPLLSPDLLTVLYQMGHGDEIVLADAHFPAHTIGPKVIRADGLKIADLLDAIIPLFELDSYADPLYMMQVSAGDQPDETVEADYMRSILRYAPQAPHPVRIERFDFYTRTKTASAIVLSGELRTYGNIILKKGVTPTLLRN
jgi:L-fucose mutarotase